MKGITLIGMSGSGKSSVGRLLAQKLGWQCIDLDKLILERQGISHDEYMRRNGEAALVKLEQEYTLGLNFSDIVFAPPGSLVYSTRAIQKAKNESTVVYLQVTAETVEKRLGPKLYKNGIVGLKEKGLQKVIAERTPLYETYADYTFATGAQTKDEMALTVLRGLGMA